MIVRQNENRRWNRIRITAVVILSMIILGVALLIARDQYILTSLTNWAENYRQVEEGSPITQVQILETYSAEQVDVIVRSVAGNNEIIDSSNEMSTANLLEIMNRVEFSTEEAIESGSQAEGYWVSYLVTDTQNPYQVLIFYPEVIFADFQHMIFKIWLVLLFIVIGLVFAIYRSTIHLVSRPIDAMNQGLEHLLDGKYSFEYVGTQFEALDNLGSSVTHLNQRLEIQRRTLINSEQRLSLLLDYLNLGVVLINPKGEVELYNPEVTEILESDDIILGRSYEVIFRSILLVDMIDQVIKTKESLREEIELFVPSSKYIDVNVIPYHGPEESDGESILVLLYDITQVKRLETVRTEFVSNASHELRTPVTAIKGFSETLLDGAIKDQELAENFVQIIYSESNRLEFIINDILELSRVEKQSEPLNITPFDITKVVNSMARLLERQAQEKSIHIDVEIAHKPIMIQADQHRIEQIMTNLIDNAINYSDIGGKIKIRVVPADKGVNVSVSDTGIGIPEKDQTRIFERFYRVDKGRSRNSGGTGLGLSIVRNLIKALNGTISVESEVGEGSTFNVYLPYKQNE